MPYNKHESPEYNAPKNKDGKQNPLKSSGPNKEPLLFTYKKIIVPKSKERKTIPTIFSSNENNPLFTQKKILLPEDKKRKNFKSKRIEIKVIKNESW